MMSKMMRISMIGMVLIALLAVISPVNEAYAEGPHAEQTEHAEAESHGEDHGGDHEGGHGGMEPLFFVIIALLIGAATRHFLRGVPLPYTVLLLLIGIGVGALERLGYLGGSWAIAFQWAGQIDPHLILFVFLPTLIFEAAFAMDVHTFKKSVANAIILAVPGILIALFLTAFMVMTGFDLLGLGLDWTWPIALMFGAVISATDPVAVVALLKELGASKKLGTLIEGESLLNDGTAIVIFMVFFLGMTTDATDALHPVLEFSRVSFGGILLGLVIAAISIAWVKRVFNDALVEITVIVAAAYLCFYIAEDFMHVSGVLGLVAMGLVFAGVGRTRISPEVEHFLHEFWELAAFIANTLIFVIVGVVIAERADLSGKNLLLLLLVYIGIAVVRAIVIVIFYPIMKRTGYGLPKKDAYVLWWGALRGAIGLALALIVANEPAIPEDIRNLFFFLIAGTVTLTLIVNATTVGVMVNSLGLTRIPAVKALMMKRAYDQLEADTESSVDLLKEDRFLGGANWASVRDYLPHPTVPPIDQEELAAVDTSAEARRRILEKEKSSYWHQFKDGLLGPVAVMRLTDGINELLDKGGSVPLNEREYMGNLWQAEGMLGTLGKIPLLKFFTQNNLSDQLALKYDMTKGFIVAQEEVSKLVPELTKGDADGSEDKQAVTTLQDEIHQNRMAGLNFLGEMREEYPEIVVAITTKQAIRSMLNAERSKIKALLNDGRLEGAEADKMLMSVESRMKQVMDTPPSIKEPEAADLLREVSWMQGLRDEVFDAVNNAAQTKTYEKGEKLMKAGDPGDGMMLVVRGSVSVDVNDFVVDILGTGSVIGEMAVLSGLPRSATVSAESAVTAIWLSTEDMQKIMASSPDLENRLWSTAGTRFAENMLGKYEPYHHWRQIKFRRWLADGDVAKMPAGKELDLSNKAAVLISGEVESSKGVMTAPAVLIEDSYTVKSDSVVYRRDEVFDAED
jgi:NhaP-type Na+/H+ or K+/H+ antiporter